MKTLQQITAEQITEAYRDGNINLSDSWATIGAENALEVFSEIVKALTKEQKSELFLEYLLPELDRNVENLLSSAGAVSSFVVRLAMVEFVQSQVEKSWNDLMNLRDEIEQGRHVDAQITEAREQSL